MHESKLAILEKTGRALLAPTQSKLKMPDGREVDQGGPEDRATWWTCGSLGCNFRGPNVGADDSGQPRCMGSCGGKTPNPNVPRCG
jgi:hypothetical protein